jgi:hypothetical protein
VTSETCQLTKYCVYRGDLWYLKFTIKGGEMFGDGQINFGNAQLSGKTKQTD